MRVLGVIPARYESSRLPGKPLALIGHRPMILRVWDNAIQVRSLEKVVVATDSDRIAEVVRDEGAEVMVTPPAPSGSDRVAWVYRQFKERGDVFDGVVNIQGDEPFLGPEAMGAAVGALECGAEITTLACVLKPEDKAKAQVVKVLVAPDGRGIDFSRRSPEPVEAGVWLKHIGIYGFRGVYLERFVSMKPSVREREERLEQLRALEDRAWIQVVVGGDWSPLGVDTPEDLVLAQQRWESLAGVGGVRKNGELA